MAATNSFFQTLPKFLEKLPENHQDIIQDNFFIKVRIQYFHQSGSEIFATINKILNSNDLSQNQSKSLVRVFRTVFKVRLKNLWTKF